MASLTFTIEPDELLGLSALVELARAADGGDPDPGTGTGTGTVSKAKALMRTALADNLEQAGLPWAPSAEAASKRTAEAAAPPSALRGLTGNGKARKGAAYAAAAALVAALWGGYTRGWQWTGFRVNGQLWDWLSLLLLRSSLHYPAVDPGQGIHRQGQAPHLRRRDHRLDRIGDRRLPDPAQLDRLPWPDALGLA
jgi:hypothetical protein